MDVSLRPGHGQSVPNEDEDVLFQRQAKRYADFFRMFVRNRDSIDAVLVWGVTDEVSWLKLPDGPLLLAEHQPKPAFWAVIDEGERAKSK
jgi:endo-1,4-beta-xylanase